MFYLEKEHDRTNALNSIYPARSTNHPATTDQTNLRKVLHDGSRIATRLTFVPGGIVRMSPIRAILVNYARAAKNKRSFAEIETA